MLALALTASAQGVCDIDPGTGLGTRTITVDMSGVTGGSVTVTSNGQATVLDGNSGAPMFQLPVDASIKIQSSNGKWVRITNLGTTYSVSKGVDPVDATPPPSGPDMTIDGQTP